MDTGLTWIDLGKGKNVHRWENLWWVKDVRASGTVGSPRPFPHYHKTAAAVVVVTSVFHAGGRKEGGAKSPMPPSLPFLKEPSQNIF